MRVRAVVTESSKGKLWKLFSLLGWSEAVVGAVLATLVSRSATILANFIPSTHQDLLYVFYVEIIAGMASVMVSVQGVLVAEACINNPSSKSTKRAYTAWIFISFLLLLFLMIALVGLPAAVEAGQEEILEVLEGGISSYLEDMEWKTIFDHLHQEFQCCGVNSISDWYTIRWIPIRSLRLEVANLKGILREDGSLGDKVVPASCCNPDVPLPCYHDALQQASSLSDPNSIVRLDTLFTRGCGHLIVDPVVSTVTLFKALAITTITLQVGQLIIGSNLYVGPQEEVGNEKSPLRPRPEPSKLRKLMTDFGQSVKRSISDLSERSGLRRKNLHHHSQDSSDLPTSPRDPQAGIGLCKETSTSRRSLSSPVSHLMNRFKPRAAKQRRKSDNEKANGEPVRKNIFEPETRYQPELNLLQFDF